MISLEQIQNKLEYKSHQIRIYFGRIISSSIFNGQLSPKHFSKIETTLKKSCKLKDIPYGLYNEYCYNNYTYHTNTKNDKLFTQNIILSDYISNDNDCLETKINHINLIDHSTFDFNVNKKFDHIQPFMESSLKIDNDIFIKLRKNLYEYTVDSPISSYQAYIIFNNNEDNKDNKNNKNIKLVSKIIQDILNC